MPSDDFGRYAKREYERRWLLRALPPQLDPDRPWARITDHYLAGTRFRAREVVRPDGSFVWKLTQKFPESPAAHDSAVITNCYLTRGEYDAFCRLPGRELVKHRWLLEPGNARYAVDGYLGGLAGLVTAEREYPTHAALLASRSHPPPPPFDGIDVTARNEFTGGELAGRTYAQIRQLVEALLR